MDPANAVALAIAAGATYVARGFSGKQKELTDLMIGAIKHKGFAVVDILQPCQTWNRQLTWKFYNERAYLLEEEGHDPSDKMNALEKAYEWGDKIPIGLFYKTETPTLSDGLALPDDGRLRDHKHDMKSVQQIIDDLLI